MSFFGKNIKKIRGVKGLSQQAFADVFDLKRGTLGAYEEGRSEPKIDTIIKIANYFSLTIDQLLTSELTVNQLLQFKDHLTITPEEMERVDFTEVSCVTEKLVEDYVRFRESNTFINDLPRLRLPISSERKFRAFTVVNLEMTSQEKGLFPKDIVIAESVPLEVVDKLKAGTIVVALTKDDLILRRVFNTDSGIHLKAVHKNVDEILVTQPEILELWRVRYVFMRREPEFSNILEDKVAFLEQQFLMLSREKDS